MAWDRNGHGLLRQGLTPSVGWGGIEVEGYAPPPNEPEMQADQRCATPGYFKTMQIPLLGGRWFTDDDNETGLPIVIVDEKLAKRFWPRGDAIGKHIGNHDGQRWLTVVGVAGVVKEYGLDTDTRMVVYFPYAQNAAGNMFLVARTSSAPATMADAVAAQVHDLDADLPVFDVASHGAAAP